MVKPSRKWLVQMAVGIAAILVMWVQTDKFNDPELIALIGLAVQGISTYGVKNSATDIVNQAAGRNDVNAVKTERAR